MRIKFKMTENDIKLGKRWSPTTCPVARTICREIAGVVRVQTDTLRLNGKMKWNLPAKVVDFIYAFDEGGDVDPITFTLDLPAKYVENKKPVRKIKRRK